MPSKKKAKAKAKAKPRAKAKQAVVDHDTDEIVFGPVTFDVEDARTLGWPEIAIVTAWADITAIVNRGTAAARKVHPTWYEENEDGGRVAFVSKTRPERGSIAVTPAILLDCPRQDDADANVSAPTISYSFYRSLFYGHDILPPWMASSALSGNTDKDYGRLLTFRLEGEAFFRVCWVKD